MSLLLNLLFERDSYSNAYLLAKFSFDTAENEPSDGEDRRGARELEARGRPPRRAAAASELHFGILSEYKF